MKNYETSKLQTTAATAATYRSCTDYTENIYTAKLVKKSLMFTFGSITVIIVPSKSTFALFWLVWSS